MGMTISTANSALYFSISYPTDDDGARRDDIVGAKIWISQTDGFTPGSGSLVHDGPDLSAVIPGLSAGDVYYVRYAIVSGIDVDDVAISNQIVAPAVDDANPATIYRIVSDDAVISQAADGTYSPSEITFSAESVTGNGLPAEYYGRFRITLNGTGVTAYQSTADEASTSFTIPEGTTKIWCGLFVAGGVTMRLDAVTVPVVLDGSSALTVVVTNPAHAVPCSSAGTPTSYTGSGTDIRVYVGDDELVYDGFGATKGTWTVSASGSGITPGSISDSGNYATVGAHNNMSTSPASVTYTIAGKRSGGGAFVRNVKQSLTKAIAGATGSTGATGPTGYQGPRGAGMFYGFASSAAWSDAEAEARILAVTGSSARIVGDTVTLTYGSNWVMTKVWYSNLTWVPPGTVIDGNLIVTGTVQSSAIDTRSLTVKNAAGVEKVFCDGSGILTLAGDIYCNGGDVFGPTSAAIAIRAGVGAGAAHVAFGPTYSDSWIRGGARMRSSAISSTGAAIASADITISSADAVGSDYYGDASASSFRYNVDGDPKVTFLPTKTKFHVPVGIDGLTASTALVSNSSKQVTSSAVTATELAYLSGVTSSVQTQISGKAAATHSHAASDITSGTFALARIPTGTTSATVAVGDHNHSGTYALASHTQAWSTITSAPTTLSGYGITDAAASSHTHSDYASKSTGNTFSGGIQINNVLGVAGTSTFQYIRPDADNTRPVGGASYRWSTVFAGTGTINTSDARQKTEVVALSSSETAVAVELSRRIGMFQFLDAIAIKGSEARWHIGMTVQDVADVFVAHGLDPWRYGCMCYDAWDADIESGLESGDGYGFRPDELLLFIAAGINARLAALEAACF